MKKTIAFFASLLSVGAAASGATAGQNMLPKSGLPSDFIAWEETKQNPSNRALVSFLLAHPDSRFSAEARQMLMKGPVPVPAVLGTKPATNGSDIFADFYQNI